jgi:hypothetical protein
VLFIKYGYICRNKIEKKMRKEELRIGNNIKIDGVIVTVDARTLFDFDNDGRLKEGVPLTEDDLLRLGFVKTDDYGDQIYYEPKDRGNQYYYICFDHDDISFGLSVFGNCTNLLYDDANLQFVHHLQNLYHALTAEELTLNN